MRNRRRRQQPPLKTATQLFVTGAIALVGAIVFPLISVSCTNDGGVQFCIETTYYGLDAHTFGIVLGVLSLLFFAGGAYYLWRHKEALAAKRNAAVYSATQPFAPQQPGVYPPVQQPGAYQPTQQPGAYPPVQQPGVYPPAQQPGVYPPAQNPAFPGSYTGDAPSQPPSNFFPRQ